MKGLLAIAEEAARDAGALLLEHVPNVVRSWGKDIKLDADRLAHEVLSDALATTTIPVLSEESAGRDFSLPRAWVIDPLDGSLNYSRGIPFAAVSVALLEKGKPVLGVVYDFERDELFSGGVGERAMLNNEPLRVSGVEEKAEAVLATGFPSYTSYETAALERYISFVQEFKKVRLLGSAALSLAWVACGRADAYYEKDIYIWDVAAGLALVEAAGGTFTLSPLDREGKCTASAGLH